MGIPFYTFLVVAFKRRSKTTKCLPNLPRSAKKYSKKLILALPGGALGVLRVHLQIFPLNYALKNLFLCPECRCTHYPSW